MSIVHTENVQHSKNSIHTSTCLYQHVISEVPQLIIEKLCHIIGNGNRISLRTTFQNMVTSVFFVGVAKMFTIWHNFVQL